MILSKLYENTMILKLINGPACSLLAKASNSKLFERVNIQRPIIVVNSQLMSHNPDSGPTLNSPKYAAQNIGFWPK